MSRTIGQHDDSPLVVLVATPDTSGRLRLGRGAAVGTGVLAGTPPTRSRLPRYLRTYCAVGGYVELGTDPELAEPATTTTVIDDVGRLHLGAALTPMLGDGDIVAVYDRLEAVLHLFPAPSVGQALRATACLLRRPRTRTIRP